GSDPRMGPGTGFSAASTDGRFVAFQSDLEGLVPGDTNTVSDIFLRDRTSKTTVRVSVAADGSQGNGPSMHPSISADGALVAFASTASNLISSDKNPGYDIFVHAAGQTTIVSVGQDGTPANADSRRPSISADG